jgi:hypothetical protein
MATSVYLSNPNVTINSVVLQDQCTSATLNYVLEQLETTAFGDTARVFGGSAVTSLQNNSIEIELYQSYASAETEDTVFGLTGIQTTIIVAPATGVASATNPIYTLTGCLPRIAHTNKCEPWRTLNYHVDLRWRCTD